MAISAGSLFASTSVSTTGQWKPVTTSAAGGGSAPAAELAKSAGKPDDSLSVGKLGQALSGRAAEAFRHLDAKSRGMLEGLVNSGAIGAEDVVRGLRYHADKAAFDRYMQETPDAVGGERAAPGSSPPKPGFSGLEQASKELAEKRKSAHADYESGVISYEALQERLKEAVGALGEGGGDKAGGAEDTMRTFANTLGANLQQKRQDYMAAKGGEVYAEEDLAAAMKLGELGFHRMTFRDAFMRYAAEADVPGLGPAAGSAKNEAAESATPAPTTPATSAPAATAPAAPAADPSNARAAVSMLQSALGGGKTAAPSAAFGGASDNNALLDALARSLKAGKA